MPDAIINGHASGYLWDGMSQEAQFADIILPACTSLERWDRGVIPGRGDAFPSGAVLQATPPHSTALLDFVVIDRSSDH